VGLGAPGGPNNNNSYGGGASAAYGASAYGLGYVQPDIYGTAYNSGNVLVNAPSSGIPVPLDEQGPV